ncbi:LacI family transcriptional regulator [Rhodococcus sp. Leaf7]|uniref:LacI family DNA-binding transcriptional regulator n=1 Tax=unclassified Rhodococcus (in: high G+C Gram-positive bacteria) TaxID=192944 RepID=UPI0006FCA80F|nr:MULTISPECIES: LacI family DNA-binding transcriptional regulator [unclassified Rhodococcus (in: high G+C Gram-positive bacteria)]KQU01971.1 LacI family transcriptional regulator [Rhodococcus sp. Leaf7]KQU38363.1 LacI family transcriptional regulator [Rhodococcus sp. Leaf247]
MIATELGVSPSTVSRVLNSRGDAASRWGSPDTVARIRSYAEETGYSPNPQASSLRTRRSGLIGVLVPRLQDYVLATIYEGIEEAATEVGLSTFVTNSRDLVELQRERTQMMIDRRVDGLIYGDAHLDHVFLDEVHARGLKFTLTSRRSGSYPSVTTDDFKGGRLVGQHLVDTGRRDVAVLAGLPFASTARDRTRGLVEALADNGLHVPLERIVYSGFDPAGGRAAIDQLLASGPLPEAIFATNDFAALGAFGALRDRGIRVPDDVAMVGYNDTPLAEGGAVPLTTVRSPMHEMGRRSLGLLLDVLAGREPEPVLLEPELIIRSSTEAPVPTKFLT